MKKILLTLVGLAVIAFTVVLVLAAFRPAQFTVQRSITIKAPPEKAFAMIEDFRRWREWSPYEELDPALKRTYSGAAKGVGAVYEWDGDGKAGQGRMEITDAPSPVRVTIKLDFVRPFPASHMAEFRLVPRGDSTELTWAMNGHNPYLGKVVSVVLDMDAIVGGDFEKGLAKLKAAAEKP